MKKEMKKKLKEAQTTIEYLVLLGVVTTIVLVSFKEFIPPMYVKANIYFNKAAVGIMGPTAGPVGNRYHYKARTRRTNYP